MTAKETAANVSRMEALLAQPPVQSGLAPFVAGLLTAALLLRADPRWQGLAVVAGLLLAVLLIVGPAVTPLTSTRKIVLASLGLPLLALALDTPSIVSRVRTAVVVLGAVAALLWVLWPVLLRRETSDVLLLGGGLALYVVALLLIFERLGHDCARLAGAGMGLALATGAATLIAASALYGQLAFALAAALGGLTALRWFRPGMPAGEACLGPACAVAVAVPLALLGAAASVYARLPFTTLPLLALAPALALIPLATQRPAWLRIVVAGASTLPPSAIAIYLSWRAAGDIAY